GAKLWPAEPGLKKLFEPRLIEEVFLVEEYAFNASQLAQWAQSELRENGIEVQFFSRAIAISRSASDELAVTVQREAGSMETIHCRYVFNCTYSGLNQFSGDFPGTKTRLKQEVTEMALMRMPEVLEDVGITVMD